MTTADAMTLKNLAGARVGVVGAGRTGLAVIDALDDLGARVHLLDARPGAADAVTAPLERVTIGDGEVQADALDETRPDLLVVSPGVPATGPVLTRARASGREVWSEIELAWRLQQARRPDVPWIVVTGTDGKTTTVGMLAAVLSAAGLNAPAVGNIGSPTITAVLEDRADVMAVELSSFQLHTTGTLSPLAAACLNLAPDHLDWHGGLEAYAADKARVYARTRRAAVYNTADAATRRMVEQADVVAGCLAVGFTLAVPGLGQVGVVEDLLVDRALHAGRRSAGLPLASLVDLAHLAPGGETERLPAHVTADALAAAALLLENPDAETSEIAALLPGPDLPTGGVLYDTHKFHDIIETGQGAVRLRATYKVEHHGKREVLVLDSLPYLPKLNKGRVMTLLSEAVAEKDRFPDITDIVDESNNMDVRIVVKLKPGASAEAVFGQLLSIRGALDVSVGYNMNVLQNGRPVQAGIRTALTAFNQFREEVILRVGAFRRKKHLDRVHIIDGFLTILHQDHFDEAIRLIRTAKGTQAAADALKARFGLDDAQVSSILAMRLSSLNALEVQELTDERTNLVEVKIAYLNRLLDERPFSISAY